jgi:hypothetical protein
MIKEKIEDRKKGILEETLVLLVLNYPNIPKQTIISKT